MVEVATDVQCLVGEVLQVLCLPRVAEWLDFLLFHGDDLDLGPDPEFHRAYAVAGGDHEVEAWVVLKDCWLLYKILALVTIQEAYCSH